MIHEVIFLVLSFVSIASALCVIFAKSPVYSVLSLVVTFLSITGHYFLLNAGFLGVVNIIVYAGAIMVLFLYVIMMLNLNKKSAETHQLLFKVAGIVSGGLLLFTLIAALSTMPQSGENMSSMETIGTVKVLGVVLFDDYLLPFEVSSVLFLSAMIGAVMLGKKNLKDH